MEQIFPSPVDDVDPHEIYKSDDRPAAATRPWVMCNMISSADGAIAIDGLSGGLGGPGDKAVFSAIRSVPDVIIVAAGTAIAENYRRPQTSPDVQHARIARGQSPLPQIVIVTNSLSIEPDHRVFDPDFPPLIITHEAAPAEHRARLEAVAEVIDAGPTRVDLNLALELLASRGAGCALLEGGPTLNAAFVDADLIDEWCLSVSPMIVGGSAGRVVGSTSTAAPRRLVLDRTLHDAGFLFHRYVRDRATTTTGNVTSNP